MHPVETYRLVVLHLENGDECATPVHQIRDVKPPTGTPEERAGRDVGAVVMIGEDGMRRLVRETPAKVAQLVNSTLLNGWTP